MEISLLYIIIFLLGFSIGAALGWFVGVKIHQVNRLKRVLRAKNPELWDLEHYVVVDEDTKKYGKITKK